MMTNTYTLSKKIHRLLVLIIMTLGLLMATTGLVLKYTDFVRERLPAINLGFIRYLHNQLSLYFAIVLILMILTGLWMYFYPKWAAHKAKQNNKSQQ